jgi:hypothetical protein
MTPAVDGTTVRHLKIDTHNAGGSPVQFIEVAGADSFSLFIKTLYTPLRTLAARQPWP